MPSGPSIVVANHDSLADPFLLGTALERPLRFLAKEELWANRPVGRVLDSLGGIPVRRGRGDLEALAAAGEALRAGHAVAIFPQGTVLGSDGRPWHRGAARLALATGASGLAGLVKLRDTLAGKTVAIILSGSNIDEATLRRVMSGEL